MAFGCTITVTAGKIPSSQGNFIWLATAANFPTTSKDGGANSILNGGGNLRCYTDSGKATRLAVDVVSFVTGVTPVIQVWGLSPTLDVASTVYIEADAVETTQPAIGAAFGRNAVHAGLENTFHLNETANNTVAGYVDSTGNSSGTGFNMATNSAIQIGDGQDFASNTKIHSGTNPVSLSDAFSIEVWIKTTAAVRGDIYSEGDANLASRYSRLTVNEASGTQDNVSFTARGDDGTGVATSADINITDGLPHKIVVNEYSRASREIFVDNVSVATDLTARGAAAGLDIQTIGCLRRTSDALFYSGAAEQLITSTVIKSADKRTAEYNNQSDASTFWSTSAWVDSGGGGSTVVQENLAQSQSIDNISLNQHSVLAIAPLSQNQSLSEMALYQNNVLTINDANQQQSIDQINLTQAHVLFLNDLNMIQALQSTSMNQNNIISTESLSQYQALEQLSLNVQGVVSVDSFFQSQSFDLITLTESGSSLLNIAKLSQQQELTGSQLLQQNLLTVDNLSNSQLVESINFGGIVLGYLKGELSIIYAYNGKVNIVNALTGKVTII